MPTSGATLGAGPPAPTVFISYRRDDSGDVTGRIRDSVASVFGVDHVYMDIDSIPFGVDFRKHLADSVAKCDVVLAVIGPRWLSETTEAGNRRLDDPSDFVRVELEAALERGIPVVPVLVLGAQPVSSGALPDTLQELAFRQAARVRRDPDFHPDMARLLEGLARSAGPAAAPSTTGLGPPATEPSSDRVDPGGHSEGPVPVPWWRRGPVLVGVALAAIAAVVVVVVLSGGGDAKRSSGTSTVPPSNSRGEFPSTAERDLLGHVPEGFRATCARFTPANAPAAKALAAVKCTPSSGAASAYYYTFPDLETMNSTYEQTLTNVGIERNTGGSECPREGVYRFEGSTAGRQLCYADADGKGHIIWTRDSLLILSEGVRADADLAALFDWWNSGGPDA